VIELELEEILKLLVSVVSIIGASIAAIYKAKETKKIKIELLTKLDESIENDKKNTACEVFNMIYGMNIPYKELKSLLSSDDANEKIRLLKAKSEAVTLEHGELKLTDHYKRKWVQYTDNTVHRVIAVISMLIMVTAIVGFSVVKNMYLAMILIGAIIIFSYLFTYSMEQITSIKRIKGAVKSS